MKVLKLKYIVYILLFFILFRSFPGFGQETDIKFRHLGIEDGLSQNSVLCILKDSRGFMWFGTKGGLNKYDGYSFINYYYNPSDTNTISNIWITYLFEDSKGMMWVGTKEGLNCYNRETEKFSRFIHDYNNPNSLSNNYIKVVYEDSEGILWVGTTDGLNRFDTIKKMFICYKNDPKNKNSISSNIITGIQEDASGVLWIDTDFGLNRFDKKTGQFKHFFYGSKRKNIFNEYNTSLFRDKQGNLLIQASNLIKFDPFTEKFINNEDDPIYPSGIEYKKPGLFFYENKFGNIVPRGLWGDINSLFMNMKVVYSDESRAIWIGTDGGGIYYWHPSSQKFPLYKHDPDNHVSLGFTQVRSLYEDSEGMLWVSGYAGLDKFDRKSGKFKHLSGYGGIVHSFHEDMENPRILWLGTENGGLIKYDKFAETNIKKYNNIPDNPDGLRGNYITSIREDIPDILWIGTETGLHRLDKSKEEFTIYEHKPDDPGSISDNSVQAICISKTGVIWVGTNKGGINRFNKETGKFACYKNIPGDLNSLSCNDVKSIYEDKSGVLWVGTSGGGLNKMVNREKGIFVQYTKKQGLPDDVIYGILEDEKGNLWLSSNKGISKFNPTEESFRNYDKNDGLQSNEFNTSAYFKSKTGEMFFGGLFGFNAFYPENIKDNSYLSPVAILNFKIFNKTVQIGETDNGRVILSKSITETDAIELSYKDYIFSIEFAALHYVFSEKCEYAYIMEGFEENWNYVGKRRFATYTNLPAGNYTFRVKASNNDGVWNEEGTSLKITVHPPFWKTLWFKLSVVVFILGAFYVWYKRRIYIIEKEKKNLEKIVKERTKDLHDANSQLEEQQADLEIKQEEITAQAEHLAYVNKELEKLSIVASNTDNAVIIMDAHGNLEWINEGFTKLYKYTFEQLINKRGKNIINTSTNPNIKSILNDLKTNKKTIIYKSLYKTMDGIEIWSQTTITPLLDENRNIIKLIAIDSDITELKKAEAQIIQKNEKNLIQNEEIMAQRDILEIANTELQQQKEEIQTQKDFTEKQKQIIEQQNKELEKKVEERTYKLIEALKKEKELGDLKSQFVSMASHEFRTPLAAISFAAGFIEKYWRKIDDKVRKQKFEKIETQVKHMTDLLDDVLLYGMAERRKIKINPEKINITEFLNLLIEEVQNVTKNTHKIKFDFDHKICYIMIDEKIAGNIFTNLLTNAIKFSPDAGHINLKLRSSESGIIIEVIDYGIGINPKELKHIFTPFYRGKNVQTIQGTGLGLAIMKESVNLLKGTITIESKIGKGTKFAVTLPKAV